MTPLLALFATLSFGSTKPKADGPEFYVRTDPSVSVERLAEVVRPFGRIESRSPGSRNFLIQVSQGINEESVKRQFERTFGVHVLGASEEPVEMNSMRSVNRKIRHLTEEEFDKRDSHGRWVDVPGAEYLQAYEYMVGRRAFPNDSFDWSSLDRARKHAEKMPIGKLKPRLSKPGSVNNAFWEFMGPTNLQVPSPPEYFGVSPINGRINAVAFDPNHPQTIYAGAAQGGLWRSFDFGVTWTWLSSSWTQLAINCIVIDPKDSNTIYVGRGDYHGHLVESYGIMKTTDGGLNWTEIATAAMGKVGVDSILMDPTNNQVLVAGTGDPQTYGGLFLSKDAGKTWVPLKGKNEDEEWPTIAASTPVHGKTRFYAVKSGKATSSGSAGRMIVSDDHGSTWKSLASPLQDTGTFYYSYEVATSPSDPNTVYVLDAQHKKLFFSTNQGGLWRDISANIPTGDEHKPNYNFSQTDYDYHLECGTRVSGTKSVDVLYLGLIDIQESIDRGATWQSIGGPTWAANPVSHNDQHALAICPTNPNVAIFSNDGGVYSLTYSPSTHLNTVASLNKGLANTMFYKIACHPTNPNIVLGGAQDNAAPFANGDLSNWLNVGGGDGGGCVINQSNPLVGFSSAENLGIWRTGDGWLTKTPISPAIGKGETLPFISPLVDRPGDPYVIYTGTNLIYSWNDTQQLWYTGADLTHGKGVISAISYSIDGVLRAGSSDGALTVYDDTISRWTFLPTPLVGAITSVCSNPKKPADFLFGYSGSGIDHLYRYHNHAGKGFTYEDVSGAGTTALPDASLNAIAWDLDDTENTWYVATDVGIFQTSDAGKHWANIGSPYGLPNVLVEDLVVVPGTRYLNAGTYGRGIWRLYLPTGQPSLEGISLSPTSLMGGNNATATVTLTAPAPSGGTTVLITGTSNLIVPKSITVPTGATMTTFEVLTNAVSADTTETISAIQHTISASSSLTLHAAKLTALKVRPATVISGIAATGEVDLDGNAPNGGVTVGLKCNVSGVVIPSSVTIAANTTSATFSIITSANQPKATATITATRGGTVLTDTFSVQPPALLGVSVLPITVVGGSQTNVTGTLTFNGPFPSGSVVVKLTSSNPAAVTVPASITVTPTASQLNFNFAVTHSLVSANAAATITATVLGQKMTTTLHLTPFQIVNFTATPSGLAGGGTALGSVQLNAAPNSKVGALTVLLSKTGTAISIPASVSIPVGETSSTFTIATSVVSQDTQATVQAKLGTSTSQVAISVLATSLTSISVLPSTFVGGSSVSVVGTVTISSPAPAGGVIIHLMSYDTSGQLTVPSTVTILAGQTSATFSVTHHTVPIQEVVQIAASVDNQTQTTSVTVTP